MSAQLELEFAARAQPDPEPAMSIQLELELEPTYYVLYKTTNIKSGKIYVGKHKTKNLNDGYYGSGISLRKDIKKLGIENFKVEHILYASSEKDLNALESIIVDGPFTARSDTYNKQVSDFCVMEAQRRGIERTKKNSPEKYKGRRPTIDGAKIRQLHSSGMRPIDIAKRLGIARSSVYNYLEKP